MDDVQGRRAGRQPGGIFALLDLIGEHRGALEYDFRARFHLPLTDIGRGVSWGEAIRLLSILRRDTSSQFAASIEKWDFPVDRETLAILDLYDLQYAKTGAKNRKPHPGRPYRVDDRERRKRGNAAGRTREQVIEILAAHGHAAPV